MLLENRADLLLAGRSRSAELVTIRAMGQTFVVRNHLPPTPPQPPRQFIPTLSSPPTSPNVAMATPVDPQNIDHTRLSDDDDDDELSTVCEDPSQPTSSPCSSSSTSPPIITSASTCADQSDDYQDFLSKFGILSLPLHPSLDRHSVVQIDSPDDTLISGSLSPFLDQLDPLLTPDVPPSVGGKCSNLLPFPPRPTSFHPSICAVDVDVVTERRSRYLFFSSFV